MVKDHSYSEIGNLLLSLHGLLFTISSKGSFICITPDRIAHTTALLEMGLSLMSVSGPLDLNIKLFLCRCDS